MSLIINMLKDLDQRHHHTTQAPALVTTHQHAEPRSHDLYKKIFIVMAVVIFMSVLLFMIMHRKTALHSMQIPVEKPVLKSALNESASDTIPLTPVSISGISFEAKTDATEVTFLLSHDALYRLVSDEKKNNLNLYIDNATMQSDLPTLIGAQIAIQHIAAFPSNGSMKFSIRLKPEATLKSVSLNKEGKQPELIISIANCKQCSKPA